jgi:hypothetical protein
LAVAGVEDADEGRAALVPHESGFEPNEATAEETGEFQTPSVKAEEQKEKMGKKKVAAKQSQKVGVCSTNITFTCYLSSFHKMLNYMIF